jgi:hypothetical protein
MLEQILDIRSTFRYLGVPIEHATVMLGERVRCQHSFHAPFEAEQTSQLPFLSQNEIVHCWLGTTIFPYPWTNKSG